MSRYLTKSRFKLGWECPTKLFYTRKPEYPDKKTVDSFLEALAEGGYQVGELAKYYYPDGHDIITLDGDEAERQTNELLQQDQVIIYEPAIRYQNLFIRVDILVKDGNHFDLIEVKAKSIDFSDDFSFFGRGDRLKSHWQPYLFDVAFQNYVLQNAYPDANINSYLMLADKTVKCATDGLNQKFKITRSDNRKGIEVSSSLTPEDLKHRILVTVPVDKEVTHIQSQIFEDWKSFPKYISDLATLYENDQKAPAVIGAKCKKCEFVCSAEQEADGLKNGFKECWSEALGWTDQDFAEPNIFQVWDLRSNEKFIEQGKIKLSELTEEDIKVKADGRPGLSRTERQWLQIEKSQQVESEAYFDLDGMQAEMNSWIFPLHFIDFETTSVALPFTKGRRPYEGIAFQFSHHIVHQDGTVEHAGQYLNSQRGVFPSFDFIRALKSQLENDSGTIFRYADHENSYLNMIYRQLQETEPDIVDQEQLLEFIRSITHSSSSMNEKWVGERDMVDMLKLVKRYYYDPQTKGSNSIKQVLPAILNRSSYLKEKYSQPIYGAQNGIQSHNFTDWTWIEIKDGKVIDPYKRLPKLFQNIDEQQIELLSTDDQLSEGGAALMAYARMQFEEMSDFEKGELECALLKYCELDTLAMVMIYEGLGSKTLN